MKLKKTYNKGQARLFQNPYLEILTKAHPLIIWSMYTPVIIYMIYYSNANFNFTFTASLVIFIGGILFWSFFEYIMHRFIFHFITESLKAQRIIYIMHGNHHEYSKDKERLFMPPVPSLILASVIFATMYIFIANYVFLFFSGFIFGYLLYGSMHYAIHAWRPPFKWMKPLWRNHHLHHYKSDDKGFGVSTTLWDHIFGTMFVVKKDIAKEAK
jgi:sterol desaturase/sphingolipid hydroxylase (fatty acid hydroxylase superfamily)